MAAGTMMPASGAINGGAQARAVSHGLLHHLHYIQFLHNIVVNSAFSDPPATARSRGAKSPPGAVKRLLDGGPPDVLVRK